METGRGWGMWCGSWMDVDRVCVRSWMGLYGEWMRSWIGVYGEWRMYWTNREWRNLKLKQI